jgi:hypothetical protein
MDMENTGFPILAGKGGKRSGRRAETLERGSSGLVIRLRGVRAFENSL